MHELYPGISTVEAETGPQRGCVEGVQWQVAQRALALGSDVVIDWGVWAKVERDALRAGARQLGARAVPCLLDPPFEELWARLDRRNADLPQGAFAIPRASLEKWSAMFQRPSDEELAQFDPWDGPANAVSPSAGAARLNP